MEDPAHSVAAFPHGCISVELAGSQPVQQTEKQKLEAGSTAIPESSLPPPHSSTLCPTAHLPTALPDRSQHREPRTG